MVDRYPNIPNVGVDLRDGRRAQDTTPTGKTPIVIGTAARGLSETPVTIYSEAQLLSQFGASGSLVRGAIEAMQGGTRTLRVYRVGATPAEVKNVANPARTAKKGFTVKMARKGRNVLADYSLLYQVDTDLVVIGRLSDEQIVYKGTSSLVDINTGEVQVEGVVGDAIAGSDGVNIGLQVAVCEDQENQVVSSAVAVGSATEVQMAVTASDPVNLGRLGSEGQQHGGRNFVASDYVVVWTNGGHIYQRDLYAFDLKLAKFAVEGDVTAIIGASDPVRFILKRVPVPLPDINENRLEDPSAPDPEPPVSMVDGSDMNGAPRVEHPFVPAPETNVFGAEETEVGPAPINNFEFLVDATDALIAVPGNLLIMKDITFDSPALDGQSIGAGKLPSDEEEGYIMSSAAFLGGTPALDTVDASPAGPQSILLADPNSPTAYVAPVAPVDEVGNTDALNTLWAAFDSAVATATGNLSAGDPLALLPALRGNADWAGSGIELSSLEGRYLRAIYDSGVDANSSGVAAAKAALDAKWVEMLAALERQVPGITANAGVDAAYTALRAAEAGSNDPAVYEAMRKSVLDALKLGSKGGLWISFFTTLDTDPTAGSFGGNQPRRDALTRVARVVDWAYDSPMAPGLVVLKLDREPGFSLDASGKVITSMTNRVDFHLFQTRQLFFHRSMMIDGGKKHMWYHTKIDPDGNRYHEVNFGHQLGAACFERGLNDYSTQAVIGVEPPEDVTSLLATSRWIGGFNTYDDKGEVSHNGSGLLANKFMAGTALNNAYDSAHQFEYGFRATETGYLDDTTLLMDGGGFPIDLGKYLSITPSFCLFRNAADSTGAGYVSSSDAIYAGLTNRLDPSKSASQKPISNGNGSVSLLVRMSRRQIDDLLRLSYTPLDYNRQNVLVVVDAPVASRKDSDFRREMTMRLTAELIDLVREILLPYLGSAFTGTQRAGATSEIEMAIQEYKLQTDGALESADFDIIQTRLDQTRGTATVPMDIKILEELRKVSIEVGLAPQ